MSFNKRKIFSNLLVSMIIIIANQHYNTYQIINDDLLNSEDLKTVCKQNCYRKTDGKAFLKIEIVLD